MYKISCAHLNMKHEDEHNLYCTCCVQNTREVCFPATQQMHMNIMFTLICGPINSNTVPFTPNSHAWVFMSAWLFVTIAFHSRHRGWRTEDGRYSYSPWSSRTSSALPSAPLLTRTEINKYIYIFDAQALLAEKQHDIHEPCTGMELTCSHASTEAYNKIWSWTSALQFTLSQLRTSLYKHYPPISYQAFKLATS
jgi:hypothetical protein